MKYLCLLLVTLPAFGQFGAASRILSGTGAPVAAQCTVENNVGLVWARKDGADAGTTFYVCGATGVGTYGWELRGGAPGGASSLTTVGSVPFVTASGVLGQNTNFRFFNATGNLVVGTPTDDGTNRLQVAGVARATGGLLVDAGAGDANAALTLTGRLSGTGFSAAVTSNQTGGLVYNANGSSAVWGHDFARGGTSQMRLTTFSNLLLGTTTEGNFRLDVGASGSAGTVRVYDQTPTTGTTSFVVRAGAGQGSNNLQTWQSAAGGVVASVTGGGFANFAGMYIGGGSGTLDLNFYRPGFTVGTGNQYFFSSTAGANGIPDLSLSRASANVLQVGDGGANANGTIRAQRITSPTSLILQPDSGTAVMGWGNGFQIPNNTGGTGVSLSGSTATPFSLDVGVSGSSGTARFYGGAGISDVTSVVVRAGAGQASNNLQTWRDASNAILSQISSSGTMVAPAFVSTLGVFSSSGIDAALDANASGAVLLRPNGAVERLRVSSTFIRTTNSQLFQFSSDATSFGTPDLALARFAAGRLEINSGTAIGTTPGNARDVMLRRTFAAETNTDPSAADLTIAGSNTQDVAAIYVKNDKLVVAYNRSGTVNYLTIPLDGATTTFTQSTTAP